MSEVEQRWIALVQETWARQQSAAVALCSAELWAARVDALPGVSARYADQIVGLFAEFREASELWRNAVNWVSEQWAVGDLRPFTELDGLFSTICAGSRTMQMDGSLPEGAVLQRDLWPDESWFAVCEPASGFCVGTGRTMMAFVLAKAWRVVHDAYRDLARLVHEPCLRAGLSAAEPTVEAAAEAGAALICRWMEALEQGGFNLGERDAVLRERERAYTAADYALGAEAGRIRAASIAGFRDRTAAVRDGGWEPSGWSAA